MKQRTAQPRWRRLGVGLLAAGAALLGGCQAEQPPLIDPQLIRTISPDEPLTCDGLAADCTSVGAVRWSVPVRPFGATYSIFSRENLHGETEDYFWAAWADNPTDSVGDDGQLTCDLDRAGDGLLYVADANFWLSVDPQTGDVVEWGAAGDGLERSDLNTCVSGYPAEESAVSDSIWDNAHMWGLGNFFPIVRVQLPDGSREYVVMGCVAYGGPLNTLGTSRGAPFYSRQCTGPVLVAIADAPAPP